VSAYVPNGRVPDSEHFRYKLARLAALRDVVSTSPAAAMVCGDMNIALTDADVFDPDAYIGETHITLAEPQRWPACRQSACATSFGIAGRTSGCSRIGTTGLDIQHGT
jgi:exonuclease III